MTRKPARNMSTLESREFWRQCRESATEVATWPAWKRAGVNAAQLRDTPRRTAKAPSASRTVWLPVEMIAELEAEAKREERSISWVLVRMWQERRRGGK